MAPDVRRAGPDDVARMGVSLSAAFADDPVFRHIAFGMSDERRAARMTPFWTATARTRLRLGGVWTDVEQRGAALWIPPGQRLPRWREVPEGLAFLRAAPRGVRRGIRALGTMERNHPRQPPHWYLSVLGTAPEHQGKGIGGALLAPVLERCDREGVPAYLESSKEANIPFYERFGFRVTGELPLGPAPAPSVWPMWRDPA